MVDDYMLDKVLARIKEIIAIKESDNTKMSIDTHDKLPDDITFKNVVVLMTYVIKDDGTFFPQLFLDEVLFLW